MKINSNQLNSLVSFLLNKNLLSAGEAVTADAVAANDFPYARQVEIADSIHYHIHVPDVTQLPVEDLGQYGGKVVNMAEGYIKYAYDGGVNFIFSHIPVAQKEKSNHRNDAAYLDHIGIDIRSEDKASYTIFQMIPFLSAQHDHLFTRQGDGKDVVKCCHMQVNEKYWVYPNDKMNYEFAFGPLVIHEGGFGVDLRPANPFNAAPVETAPCCGTPKTTKAAIFVS